MPEAATNDPITVLAARYAELGHVRPTVVGKPTRAAAQEVSARLGVPSADLLVTGAAVRMDSGLGRLGGVRTVLVRTGITGNMDLVAAIRAELASLAHVVNVPYAGGPDDALPEARSWEDLLAEPAPLRFDRVAFDHPLYVLF